jgi:carbon storage regulator
MLVLTRHQNQSLQVGETVTLKILSVDNGNVRFGIDAPADVLILREELLDRMDGPFLKASIGLEKQKPTQPQVTYKRRKKLVRDQ